MKYDYLIVGAGLTGSIIARELKKRKKTVLIIDKRDHIGGNCYSEEIEGIDVHKYGPHVFHTDNYYLWDYVNSFGRFYPFKQVSYAEIRGRLYNWPINLKTVCDFGCDLNPVPLGPDRNFETVCLSKFGKVFYDVFIKDYTRKMWGVEPSELPEELANRVEMKHSLDCHHFQDAYQGVPECGWGEWFNRLLKDIPILLNTNYLVEKKYFDLCADIVIYTGPIDKFYFFRYGSLSWRSLRIETKVFDFDDLQFTSIIYYPEKDISFTRISEYKWFLPKRTYGDKTAASWEYPYSDVENPYYPMRMKQDMEIFKKYQKLAEKERRTIFCGRLADYKYYNMDQAIERAFEVLNKL